jgi:hypothetical protein
MYEVRCNLVDMKIEASNLQKETVSLHIAIHTYIPTTDAHFENRASIAKQFKQRISNVLEVSKYFRVDGFIGS